MKNDLTKTVLEWAEAKGWKVVSIAIMESYAELVGEPVEKFIDTARIYVLAQRIKRIYTTSTPRYVRQRKRLEQATLRALPRRLQLEVSKPDCCELKISSALETFGGAMAALTMKCPTAAQKLSSAISKLEALYPVASLFS